MPEELRAEIIYLIGKMITITKLGQNNEYGTISYENNFEKYAKELINFKLRKNLVSTEFDDAIKDYLKAQGCSSNERADFLRILYEADKA